MSSVRDVQGSIPLVVLDDAAAGSRVEVAPARGGMVRTFSAQGRDWLYVDEATFADAAKNVRGGIPVLFPSPGKLAGDAFAHAGRSGRMKQHGFARTSAWREVARGVDGAAWVSLELRDSAQTLAQFPWPFRARIRYALVGATLTIGIEVENPGATPLPFGFGFHPYFAVPQADKARCQVPTSATRAWDNSEGRERALDGIDLTAHEVDLHLHEHGGPAAKLITPQGTVSLHGSAEFEQWVVWTLAGKDFVCLEPWTCPGNALNTGDRLISLAPGARTSLSLEISVAR